MQFTVFIYHYPSYKTSWKWLHSVETVRHGFIAGDDLFDISLPRIRVEGRVLAFA
jgi:hypothetical protein